MKRRMSNILTDESVGSTGQTFLEYFPSDYMVTMLAITQVGLNVTDIATLAEVTSSIDVIEVQTKQGTPIKVYGEDLYYFNKDFYGKEPYITRRQISTNAVDNLPRWLTMFIPLNPMGVWDGRMGVAPESKGQLKVIMDSDTNAGMDNRSVTVTAFGIEGGMPASYMGMFLDSFTAVAADNFKDIQKAGVLGLMGAELFVTTGPEDMAASATFFGAKKIGYAIAKSLKEKARADQWQAMNSLVANVNQRTDVSEAPISDYVLVDFGLRRGEYVPFQDDLQIYIEGGVAEAMRLYPLLAVMNTR